MTTIKKLQKLFDGADSSLLWSSYGGDRDPYRYCYHSFYECPKTVAVEVEITQAQCKLAYNTGINMGPIWISLIPGAIASLIDKDPSSWSKFFQNWLIYHDQLNVLNSILKFDVENDTSGSRYINFPSLAADNVTLDSTFGVVQKFKMQPGDRLYAFVRGELVWGTTEYKNEYDTFDNYFTVSATIYEETHAGEVAGTLVNRALRAWGYNDVGNIGTGTASGYSSPIQVGSVADWKTITKGELLVTGTVNRYYNTRFAVRNDGTLWSAGYNSEYGQRGCGTAPDGCTSAVHPTIPDTGFYSIGGDTYNAPSFHNIGWLDVTASPDGTRAFAIAYSREKRYELYGWGKNTKCALGVGDQTHRSIPTKVANIEGPWKSVTTGGDISYCIDSRSGTLWGWGDNGDGLLGHNTSAYHPLTTYVNYPTPLVGSTWNYISTNGEYTLGIKKEGTLWAWGKNPQGQLGNGTISSSIVSAPVQVGSDTSWLYCVAGGQNTAEFAMASFGIKNNGTLWAWGRNNFGQLGLGDTNDRSAPVQVGTDNDWSKVYYLSNNTFAIKIDGSLWAWGENRYGSLATGDVVSRSVPTFIGQVDDKWHVVAPGLTTHAIKAA